MLRLLLFGLMWISCLALDNNLARTPPMGWLSWERFRCNLDCVTFPDDCISERLYKSMADRMAADGYLTAGYEYVIVDDCWLEKTRDKNGRLQADHQRFPGGMKALADYVHSKGLKFGIYEDFGTKTCAGYPGSEYYMQLDAQTFADWGVDYLKLDGCYNEPKMFQLGYPPMAFYLEMTGRPIVLSCEYPTYELKASLKPNYTGIAEACNLARNTHDIQDSWSSVLSGIEIYGNNLYDFASVAGPGFWNDPDMLIVGDFGLSYDQERVQMGMWCLMASPLLMSVDLRTIRNDSRLLLQNPHVIAINQDPLGVQGTLLKKDGKTEIWSKPLAQKGSVAFAILNLRDDGAPAKISINLPKLLHRDIGAGTYKVTEVFENQSMGVFNATSNFVTMVNPTGIFLGTVTTL